MDVGNSVRRKNSEEVALKSMLWKTIVDLYKVEKNIDISSYLVSITFRGSTFFVKTNKPIINHELLLLGSKILEIFETKTKKVGIKLKEKQLKFI